METYGLTLVQCNVQNSGNDFPVEVNDFLIAAIDPSLASGERPYFRYHLAVDTNGYTNEFVREMATVDPDWQSREKEREELFIRFLSDSGVVQPAGAYTKPQFHLIAAGQKNT